MENRCVIISKLFVLPMLVKEPAYFMLWIYFIYYFLGSLSEMNLPCSCSSFLIISSFAFPYFSSSFLFSPFFLLFFFFLLLLFPLFKVIITNDCTLNEDRPKYFYDKNGLYLTGEEIEDDNKHESTEKNCGFNSILSWFSRN